MNPLRITVWSEFRHEKRDEPVRKIYPDGMHVTLKAAIEKLLPQAMVRTATLDEPDHGITDELLANTDVMTWWGHTAHGAVRDEIVEKLHRRVLEGMGILFLHSAHYAKLFKKLMGTGCGLHWREAGELERLFVVNPAHPIADGVPAHFELPHEEMYGEYFDVPRPEDVVMISWFAGGNVFRSCCTWTRGKGRVAYFRPGHETYPTYLDPMIQKVIANCVAWAAPVSSHHFSLESPNEAVPLNRW